MKIYRVSVESNSEHQGYSFHSSRGAAEKAIGEAKGRDFEATQDMTLDVELNKAGVLRALNIWGGHPDNG